MAFLDKNYLLDNEEAEKIYTQIKDLPVVDAHNHGDVEEILENEGWNDIWEVEGATDHYVWELMRRRGVPEEKVTGSASNKEKWLALAEIFPEIAGNPTYEWVHLDLKRRFGIEKNISEHTAEVIWEKTSAMLDKEEMQPQNLLREMNVEIMCTTDDPDSLLEYHQQAQDEVKGIEILPTWRPDKAMNIEKAGWKDFIKSLGEAYEIDTNSFSGFIKALQESHDLFEEMGCAASDHGIREPKAYPVKKDRAQEIFQKAVNNKDLTGKEIDDFKAYMLLKFGKMNEASGWVTQIHIGAVRDYRDSLYDKLGADAGGDIAVNNINIVDNMRYFFNEFDGSMEIVLYYLDRELEPSLATICRAFPNVSLGAPWWFNDSAYGMEHHLKYVSTVDLISNHAGMVTDSRKLISYGSRTELFRRVLSSVLGEMVERGQMPFNCASDIAASISYQRPLNLFFK